MQYHVISDMLNDMQPSSVLCVAQKNEHFKEIEGTYFNVSELLNLPFTHRYDVACMVFDGDLSELLKLQAVVRLRDLLARRVLVVSSTCDEKLLRSLGFTCLVQANKAQVWQFNILEYKHIPDWFNAKFWANPQNWDKFRW